MKKPLIQVLLEVDGLIPAQVKLKRRVWLAKGEVLLEKSGDRLNVHVLHEGEHTFNVEERVLPYFKFCPLISSNHVSIEGGAGFSIPSREDFGKRIDGYPRGEVSVHYPEEATEQIEPHVPGFLRQMRRLHNRYIDVVNDNKFISVAVDFLFEANNKTIFSDEGFLSAVICLEALYNEGPSDVSYKIAHRAGFLTGLHEGNAIEAFRNLKTIYAARSKLVHGSGSLNRVNDSTRYSVIRYARTSLKIFLALLKNARRRKLKKGDRKSSLLLEIDCAMLDIKKRESLRREIERGMGAFKLDVPRTIPVKGKQGSYRVTPW